MSTKRLKAPQSQEQAERPFRVDQSQFLGMIKNSLPPGVLPSGYSYRNINMYDTGLASVGRPGTHMYSNVAKPEGYLNAKLYHRRKKKIISHRGMHVYVSDLKETEYALVPNISAFSPGKHDSALIELEDDALLLAGEIYRIVLDNDAPYMMRVNHELPTELVTGIREQRGVHYGHRYTYAMAFLTGYGDRDRISDPENVRLVFESGVVIGDDKERYWAECFYQYPIGSEESIVDDREAVSGYYTLPYEAQEMTHFSVYRSMNIGRETKGEVNNPALLCWVKDIPVARPFIVSISGNTATLFGAGQNEFKIDDVGTTLFDIDGNSGLIVGLVSGSQVTLNVGHALAGRPVVAYGEGRVGLAVQNGNVVEVIEGCELIAGDVGRPIYRNDGTHAYVVSVDVVAQTAVVSDSVDRGLHAITMQNVATTDFAFRRRFKDTIEDDATGMGEIGLFERLMSKQELYLPQVLYQPIPIVNTGCIDSGIFMCAWREDVEFFYSSTAHKGYALGYYMKEHQFQKVHNPIMLIRAISGIGIVYCLHKTFTSNLKAHTNVGNQKLGDFVVKLAQASEVGSDIGVRHWRTIVALPGGRHIAVTNEPAVRLFDGQRWSVENLANAGDFPAVMDELNAIDPGYDVVASYSHKDGYLIWYFKWLNVYDDCDDIIIDCGGTSFVGPDQWIDIGGSGPADIIDVGGQVCGNK
jgi:putative intracellular protease/amidase